MGKIRLNSSLFWIEMGKRGIEKRKKKQWKFSLEWGFDSGPNFFFTRLNRQEHVTYFLPSWYCIQLSVYVPSKNYFADWSTAHCVKIDGLNINALWVDNYPSEQFFTWTLISLPISQYRLIEKRVFNLVVYSRYRNTVGLLISQQFYK